MSGLGRMRHRIILEETVDVPDEAGGFVRTWQTAATLWASLEPKNAALRWSAEQSGMSVTHALTMRARDGITVLHRFRLGTRIFEIKALCETADNSGFLNVLVEEQKP